MTVNSSRKSSCGRSNLEHRSSREDAKPISCPSLSSCLKHEVPEMGQWDVAWEGAAGKRSWWQKAERFISV